MTVLDTSVLLDVLLDTGVAPQANHLIAAEREAAAPDVIVFEALAALRRAVQRGDAEPDRAAGAITDLGDVSLALFPAMPLRWAAWELRSNLTMADALFAALAVQLDEPLATKDAALAVAAGRHAGADVILLAE